MQEKELNFVIKDLEGLLTYLRNQTKEVQIKKTFNYFEDVENHKFYIRTEEWEYLEEEKKEQFLTIKYGFIKKENGVQERTEMTTTIDDVPFFLNMFNVIGVTSGGSKTKIQHKFEFNNIVVTVDEWIKTELGNRLEIEANSEEELFDFKEKILEYVEI